jgi:hypothetical protein
MQLRNALLCMDCDEVFVAELYPKCAGRFYVPLRRWIPPKETIRKEKPDEAGQSN